MKKIIKSFISMFIFVFIFSINTIKSLQGITIPIAMATDNNYAYPTIVAMTSILENKNPKAKIDFYIMLSGNFDKSLKDKIESLEKKYGKCSINFIDMKEDLKDLHVSERFPTAIYYRFRLPDLLPNLDKILYMDVDTITQHDLSSLFNINIDNYYFAGIADKDAAGVCGPLFGKGHKSKDILIKIFRGEKNLTNKYVNSGILLLNLKKMRKDESAEKLINFVQFYKPTFPDQDALNYVCHNKIKNIDKTFNCSPYKIKNIKDQTIIHYLGNVKPWNDKNSRHADIWWNYAKKARLINEIQKKFSDKSKIHSKKRWLKTLRDTLLTILTRNKKLSSVKP